MLQYGIMTWNTMRYSWFQQNYSIWNELNKSVSSSQYDRVIVFCKIGIFDRPIQSRESHDALVTHNAPSFLFCMVHCGVWDRCSVGFASLVYSVNNVFHFDSKWMPPRCREHSGYGFSKWHEALLSNASSHWPSPHPEWSLRCSLQFHLAS